MKPDFQGFKISGKRKPRHLSTVFRQGKKIRGIHRFYTLKPVNKTTSIFFLFKTGTYSIYSNLKG